MRSMCEDPIKSQQRRIPKKVMEVHGCYKKNNRVVLTLKTEDGLATGSRANTEALSKQHQSVFASEDLTNCPSKGIRITR